MSFSRRQFAQLSLGLPSVLAFRFVRPELLKQFAPDRLSFKAYRTTHWEGEKVITDIEGTLPAELNGSFYKIGPGTKEIFGTPLRHFFDGDAYVSKLSFTKGRIELSAKFLANPQRLEEQESGQMLYHEFGTAAPSRTQKGRKNQTNINIISWNNHLLALSEGGHPAAFDSEFLNFKEFYDFDGSLPKNVSFSAHPKFDPETGEGFAFGIHQSISRALKVFRMDPVTKQLTELYSIKQKQVHMIHDMAMTKDHLVFLIPPAYFKLSRLVLGREPLSEAIEFDPRLGSRLLVLDKKGQKDPLEITLPSYFTFHHGNAFVEDDVLSLQSFIAVDASLLGLIDKWHAPDLPKVLRPDLCEIKVDLKTKNLLSLTKKLASHDFPVFNSKMIGLKNRYLYAASMERDQDVMAFNKISKFDFQTDKVVSYSMNNSQMCGEPVFIPHPQAETEDLGWLGFLAYDAIRDESFFEILDAQTMKFQTRLWMGEYLPAGFHGQFFN